MSNANIEQLEKNIVKLTITVPHSEIEPYLEEAAQRLSEETKIDGFRPGKAGYDVVKQRVGEMKIYEEALESIVRKAYLEALLSNKIETIGSPKIDIEKLAPGNDLVFTAEVSRMPSITTLADPTTYSVEKKEVKIEQKDIDLALKDLQRMQTKEVRADKDTKVHEKNKVVLSMNMKKDGVPVEGGQSPNHIIFMTEDYYVPGLKDKLISMKEGEGKKFTLPFPKDHTQKLLAGQDIEFEISLKEIYNLELPELDDKFASNLGQKDIDTLKELLKTNMTQEKEGQETMRQEKEMLEKLAENSRFEEIPDLLVNEEINKMIQELQHNVESQGGNFDDYLKAIKKTLAQIKLDFTPQALTRIKVALIMRELAKKENITVDSKEVDEELDQRAAMYDNDDLKKKIYDPAYRDYIESMMKNRKVIDHLRTIMIK
ncbi:trigger factor [Patescibacteria group bacterium]